METPRVGLGYKTCTNTFKKIKHQKPSHQLFTVCTDDAQQAEGSQDGSRRGLRWGLRFAAWGEESGAAKGEQLLWVWIGPDPRLCFGMGAGMEKGSALQRGP